MSVKALFLELNEWKNRLAQKANPMACDSLALISLRITRVLLNNGQEAKIIAKHLSLVLDAYQEEDVGAVLASNILMAEKALAEDLRGFSELLQLVLSEHHLSRNSDMMLKEVQGIDRGIINCFDQFRLMLKAYFDLSMALAIEMPKATTMMFLLTISTIYNQVFGPKKNLGFFIIFRWLKERVRNDEISKLYQGLKKKNFCRSCPLELLVLAICHKSAKGEAFKVDEVLMFDQALNSAGMVGIGPLLDSGILVLKEP